MHVMLPPDSDALKDRCIKAHVVFPPKMQNLNLPTKKQHNKPKVMAIPQNKGLYSSKLTISWGKSFKDCLRLKDIQQLK